MKELFFCMFIAYVFLPATTVYAEELDNLDQGNLISAIDDYRFSDYDIAIEKLEVLHKKTPKNPDVLQYLALSYDESSNPNKAIPFFEKWLTINNYNTKEDARFAWLGLANAYMKTNQPDQAISTLNRWLEANPNDQQSQITLGDLLVRQQKYMDSNIVWDKILQNSLSKSEDKAAAWYYKAWLAYLNNDISLTTNFAQKSLDADSEGAYATTAQRLKDNPSQQQLGFNGFASVEAFYNSNVILAPENSSTYSRDLGIQTTVALGWALPKVNLNYIFSSTNHQDYKTYDLTAHILSASWQKDNRWRFKPTYEYIVLDNDKLYQGFGLGMYYTQQAWIYQYTVKLKQFNNSYGTNNVDLERLGGSSHYLGAKKNIILWDYKTSLSPYFIAEFTNGDATHDNSDTYYQIGGNAVTSFPLSQAWKTQLKLDVYSRFYAAADPNILLNASDTTKRQDNYFKIASSTSWKPWESYDISLIVNASYMKNSSNYNDNLVNATASKAYSAWRLGSMIAGQW